MVCFELAGLHMALAITQGLEQVTGDTIGLSIVLGRHVHTGELIAEIDSDIGVAAPGIRPVGFPKIAIKLLEGVPSDQHLFFRIEPFQLNGHPWFKVVSTHAAGKWQYLCVDQ
jgi:hypothetical protein